MEGNAGLHRNIFSEESKNGACKYWNSTSEYSRSFTLQKAMIEILVLWWCDIIFTYSKENYHFLILSTALPSTWWWRASSCSAPQRNSFRSMALLVCFCLQPLPTRKVQQMWPGPVASQYIHVVSRCWDMAVFWEGMTPRQVCHSSCPA